MDLRKLKQAVSSWKTLSIVLLSFASGLPLGLVWIAIPDGLKSGGIDITAIGMMSLAQLPWSFKPIWAPLMDRYAPPFLGRRRGWILICQIALAALTLFLAFVPVEIDSLWTIGLLSFAIAFFSASQDIALDGYAVELLNKDEQGVVVGGRIALYRAAMYVAGSLSITIAGAYSWSAVYVLLALTYLPMFLITLKARETAYSYEGPKTITEAFIQPLKELLTRDRAVEILLFVVLYKLADNLGQALLRPFLVDLGYSAMDRGVALGTIGLAATLVGTFIGGIATSFIGLGYALWFFGFLQIFSNIGYVVLVGRPPEAWLMYSAMGFESFTQGLGAGAFSVLLMRLTQKRFSVTQYAVLSSLFSLSRVFSGPISGYMVASMGWKTFFIVTMVAGIPGLLLLQRFSPWGEKDPQMVEAPGSANS